MNNDCSSRNGVRDNLGGTQNLSEEHPHRQMSQTTYDRQKIQFLNQRNQVRNEIIAKDFLTKNIYYRPSRYAARAGGDSQIQNCRDLSRSDSNFEIQIFDNQMAQNNNKNNNKTNNADSQLQKLIKSANNSKESIQGIVQGQIQKMSTNEAQANVKLSRIKELKKCIDSDIGVVGSKSNRQNILTCPLSPTQQRPSTQGLTQGVRANMMQRDQIEGRDPKNAGKGREGLKSSNEIQQLIENEYLKLPDDYIMCVTDLLNQNQLKNQANKASSLTSDPKHSIQEIESIVKALHRLDQQSTLIKQQQPCSTHAQTRVTSKIQTAKQRRGRENKVGLSGTQPLDQSQKLNKQLKDLTKIGKDLKRLAKEQKMSQVHFTKIKHKQLVSEQEIRKQWFQNEEQLDQINQLLKMYPAMRHNKHIQNQLKHLQNKQNLSADEYDPEIILKGVDRHFIDDFSKLLAKSDDQGSTQDNKEAQNNNINFEFENHILKQISNSSDQSETRHPQQINRDENELKNDRKGQNCKNRSSIMELEMVKQGLKACKGKEGFFNPAQAFDCLNQIQKEQDPNAYQPEVVKQFNAQLKRDQLAKEVQEMQQKAKEDKAKAIDRALFDFDEEIDNLREVEDRYPMNLESQKVGQPDRVDEVGRGESPPFDKQQSSGDLKDNQVQQIRNIKPGPLSTQKIEQKCDTNLQEAQKPPQIPQRFFVKRAQRPNMDENVLRDLEKIKRTMGTGGTKGGFGNVGNADVKTGEGFINNTSSQILIDYKPPPIYEKSKQDQDQPNVDQGQELATLDLQKCKKIQENQDKKNQNQTENYQEPTGLQVQNQDLVTQNVINNFKIDQNQLCKLDNIPIDVKKDKHNENNCKKEGVEYSNNAVRSNQRQIQKSQTLWRINQDKSRTLDALHNDQQNKNQKTEQETQDEMKIKIKLNESISKYLQSRHDRLNSSKEKASLVMFESRRSASDFKINTQGQSHSIICKSTNKSIPEINPKIAQNAPQQLHFHQKQQARANIPIPRPNKLSKENNGVSIAFEKNKNVANNNEKITKKQQILSNGASEVNFDKFIGTQQLSVSKLKMKSNSQSNNKTCQSHQLQSAFSQQLSAFNSKKQQIIYESPSEQKMFSTNQSVKKDDLNQTQAVKLNDTDKSGFSKQQTKSPTPQTKNDPNSSSQEQMLRPYIQGLKPNEAFRKHQLQFGNCGKLSRENRRKVSMSPQQMHLPFQNDLGMRGTRIFNALQFESYNNTLKSHQYHIQKRNKSSCKSQVEQRVKTANLQQNQSNYRNEKSGQENLTFINEFIRNSLPSATQQQQLQLQFQEFNSNYFNQVNTFKQTLQDQQSQSLEKKGSARSTKKLEKSGATEASRNQFQNKTQSVFFKQRIDNQNYQMRKQAGHGNQQNYSKNQDNSFQHTAVTLQTPFEKQVASTEVLNKSSTSHEGVFKNMPNQPGLPPKTNQRVQKNKFYSNIETFFTKTNVIQTEPQTVQQKYHQENPKSTAYLPGSQALAPHSHSARDLQAGSQSAAGTTRRLTVGQEGDKVVGGNPRSSKNVSNQSRVQQRGRDDVVSGFKNSSQLGRRQLGDALQNGSKGQDNKQQYQKSKMIVIHPYQKYPVNFEQPKKIISATSTQTNFFNNGSHKDQNLETCARDGAVKRGLYGVFQANGKNRKQKEDTKGIHNIKQQRLIIL